MSRRNTRCWWLYSAEREQWADVLTYARRLPPVGCLERVSGQPGPVPSWRVAGADVRVSSGGGRRPTLTLQFESLTATAQRVPLECGDILFDLGRINESQHMAYEALELFGERPHTLQRLVYLHAIKGEPDAARRFLAVLERSLVHRRWARDCLQQLDADPTLAGVPVVASRRALMVERDFTGRLDLETMLGQLLERNPRNRMAFEYLMAYYLLTRRIDKMVANLHRFDDFGQARLPRHCEEAIVIHLDDDRLASDRSGRTPDPSGNVAAQRLNSCRLPGGFRGTRLRRSRRCTTTLATAISFSTCLGTTTCSRTSEAVTMKRLAICGIVSAGLLAVAGLVGIFVIGPSGAADLASAVAVDRVPRIRPDYSGTVIPPNIAPLNFLVEEPGTDYRVRIRADQGAAIDVASRSGSIVIPLRPWQQLLGANRGRQLTLRSLRPRPRRAVDAVRTDRQHDCGRGHRPLPVLPAHQADLHRPRQRGHLSAGRADLRRIGRREQPIVRARGRLCQLPHLRTQPSRPDDSAFPRLRGDSPT